MERFISTLTLLGITLINTAQTTNLGSPYSAKKNQSFHYTTLSQESLDLKSRYPDPWVNEVFSDNILLNLHYLKGDAASIKNEKGGVDWEKVRGPFEFSMRLESGQTFAYHRTVLPEFKEKEVLAAQTTFWASEGYKSDGYLVGDGVCHLASLFNWTGSGAGLKVTAKANHDFLPVPGVPRRYGTSIYYTTDGGRNSANQNLYITNEFNVPVEFKISANAEKVKIQVVSEGEVLPRGKEIPTIITA